jgi:hypothetical protein
VKITPASTATPRISIPITGSFSRPSGTAVCSCRLVPFASARCSSRAGRVGGEHPELDV